jgi:hypothetical protein
MGPPLSAASMGDRYSGWPVIRMNVSRAWATFWYCMLDPFSAATSSHSGTIPDLGRPPARPRPASPAAARIWGCLPFGQVPALGQDAGAVVAVVLDPSGLRFVGLGVGQRTLKLQRDRWHGAVREPVARVELRGQDAVERVGVRVELAGHQQFAGAAAPAVRRGPGRGRAPGGRSGGCPSRCGTGPNRPSRPRPGRTAEPRHCRASRSRCGLSRSHRNAFDRSNSSPAMLPRTRPGRTGLGPQDDVRLARVVRLLGRRLGQGVAATPRDRLQFGHQRHDQRPGAGHGRERLVVRQAPVRAIRPRTRSARPGPILGGSGVQEPLPGRPPPFEHGPHHTPACRPVYPRSVVGAGRSSSRVLPNRSWVKASGRSPSPSGRGSRRSAGWGPPQRPGVPTPSVARGPAPGRDHGIVQGGLARWAIRRVDTSSNRRRSPGRTGGW